MTPRERQARFRRNAKEISLAALLVATTFGTIIFAHEMESSVHAETKATEPETETILFTEEELTDILDLELEEHYAEWEQDLKESGYFPEGNSCYTIFEVVGYNTEDGVIEIDLGNGNTEEYYLPEDAPEDDIDYVCFYCADIDDTTSYVIKALY